MCNHVGSDYVFPGVNISVELVFLRSTECFTVSILPNDIVEDDEMFTLNLQTPPFTIVDDVTVTIVDGDSKCDLIIADTNYVVEKPAWIPT